MSKGGWEGARPFTLSGFAIDLLLLPGSMELTADEVLDETEVAEE